MDRIELLVELRCKLADALTTVNKSLEEDFDE